MQQGLVASAPLADSSDGNSTDEGEGLNTDSSCGTSLAILLEETAEMVEGELIVGRFTGR